MITLLDGGGGTPPGPIADTGAVVITLLGGGGGTPPGPIADTGCVVITLLGGGGGAPPGPIAETGCVVITLLFGGGAPPGPIADTGCVVICTGALVDEAPKKSSAQTAGMAPVILILPMIARFAMDSLCRTAASP